MVTTPFCNEKSKIGKVLKKIDVVYYNIVMNEPRWKNVGCDERGAQHAQLGEAALD